MPLYYAHSGLRYLVLLAAFVAVLYLAFGLLGRRPFDRPARILTAVFVGLLDLQALLGIVLALFRPFYPALSGHIAMMLLAVAAAHGFSVAAKRREPPRTRYALSLAAVGVALLLVVAGILSIRPGVFASTLP